MLSEILVIDVGCRGVASTLTERLSAFGWRVMETFDLHTARLGHPGCPCPYHDTDHCDCEMIVLLVHGRQKTPTAIVLHGNLQRTWLSLVDQPEQPAESAILRAVQKVMVEGLPSARL